MRTLLLIPAALVAAGAGIFLAWRRNPRIGTRFVNDVLNPLMVERGLAGTGRAEVGTLEHVGRRSGTRHLTPVHPVPTADGFRIVVPLAGESQWARNVIAAGRCRLQLHDVVYELDEPVLLAPDELPELGAVTRLVTGRLGFQYLLLHRFADQPGALDEEPTVGDLPLEPPVGVAPDPAPAG